MFLLQSSSCMEWGEVQLEHIPPLIRLLIRYSALLPDGGGLNRLCSSCIAGEICRQYFGQSEQVLLRLR
jgi:hypothetical protein